MLNALPVCHKQVIRRIQKKKAKDKETPNKRFLESPVVGNRKY